MWRYLTRTGRIWNRCISTKSSRTGGWWDDVIPAPKDPITGVTESYLADPSPNKINLGVGAYRDDDGRPLVLQCVREAEAKVAGSEFLGSISAEVNSKMVEECVKLVYGENSDVVLEGRFAGLQALSGTGACRLFAEFQRRFRPESLIYFPDPTWSNHHNIWRDAQVPQRSFHYYDPVSKGLKFAAMMEDIKKAPNGSIFLLHPCAHNPTGVDPTEEEWREISYQFKVKNHFPFFDMAYQGFASGDLDKDARAIRIFLEDKHLIGCAQSFAKNMGLYGHRVGCLSILCNDSSQATAVNSRLQQIARAMYGSPPVHGMLLVSEILSNPDIRGLWIEEIKAMVNRIQKMRTALQDNLEEMGSCRNWEHITKQVGMFCFSGLTPLEIDRLAREFHVYMTRDGRISMAGITTGNIKNLANAIHEVTRSNVDTNMLRCIGV